MCASDRAKGRRFPSWATENWPFLLYALTGFTGVLAEQGFEKYMSLLVGATAAASAVVIATYFLGFALGSWGVAVLVRRGVLRRPLLAYGFAELAIGTSCVVFSYTFHPITEALGPWQTLVPNMFLKVAVRFLFGAILVLPTAALMGASFPLIAHAVDGANRSHGKYWLRAYASNLAGAVFAAVSGAYLVLPRLGIRGAFWLCFAICSVVFGFCIVLRGNRRILSPENALDRKEMKSAPLDKPAMVLLAGAFASGFVFFALEILWTHLIATVIGCSVYSFSAMLSSVLLGLLIATFRVEKLVRKGRPVSFSRILQFGALFLVIQLRLWDWGQAAFLVPLPARLANFYGAEAFKLLLAALLIVPPAVLLGSVYPCLLRAPLLERPGRCYLVGYLNMWNSLGCLAGAISGVFVLVPLLGAETSLKLIISGCLVLSLVFLWIETPSRRLLLRTAFGVGIVFVYTLAIRWDYRILTSGLNVYFGSRLPDTPAGDSGKLHTNQKMVFFEEDIQGGMTTVLEMTTVETSAREKILLTNGKFEGTDSFEHQGIAQIGVAAVPSLFTRRLDRALLVGLGTGHSALVLSKLGYHEVEVAEFAEGIIAASRTQYGHITQRVLDASNVSLKIEDGRNVLLTDRRGGYDLITIDITSVWFAGATNVYSREFYKLARSRLRRGGVLQQWIQLHHTGPREMSSIIATVRSVFPYVSCWFAGGQGMIVATLEPQVSDVGRETLVAERIYPLIPGTPEEKNQIAREMLRSRIVEPSGIDRLIRTAPPVINTDHNRWLEYATPKHNSAAVDTAASNIAFLRGFGT